ncbi:MAG: hypothetical protein ABJP90_16210 [Paracoccaceae bacterium]
MSDGETQKVDLTKATLGPPPAQIKQFDFLIGSWEATTKSYLPDGSLQGEHRGRLTAEYRNGGRMIIDDFVRLSPEGEEISYAATMRTFCEETGMWEMSFLFSLRQEHTSSFRGRFIDGEGHFDAVIALTPESSARAKVRFFDIKQSSFEWSMEHSPDGGESWFVGERISAKRAA